MCLLCFCYIHIHNNHILKIWWSLIKTGFKFFFSVFFHVMITTRHKSKMNKFKTWRAQCKVIIYKGRQGVEFHSNSAGIHSWLTYLHITDYLFGFFRICEGILILDGNSLYVFTLDYLYHTKWNIQLLFNCSFKPLLDYQGNEWFCSR